MKVTNLGYDELVTNPNLVSAFTSMMKEVFATQAGGGVLPEDVSITLYRGSIVVDAFVSLVHANKSAADQVASQLGGDWLAGNIAAAVSDVDGISTISTGVVGVEVTVLARRVDQRRERDSETLASAPAAAPASSPAASPAGAAPSAAAVETEPDWEVCYPHCVEGRGICVEGKCYCKSPYHGMRCHRVLGATVLVDSTIAFLLVFISLCLGLLFAGVAFKLRDDKRKDSQFEDPPTARQGKTTSSAPPPPNPMIGKHEIWRPHGGE